MPQKYEIRLFQRAMRRALSISWTSCTGNSWEGEGSHLDGGTVWPSKVECILRLTLTTSEEIRYETPDMIEMTLSTLNHCVPLRVLSWLPRKSDCTRGHVFRSGGKNSVEILYSHEKSHFLGPITVRSACVQRPPEVEARVIGLKLLN